MLFYLKDENGMPGELIYLIMARNVLNPTGMVFSMSNACRDITIQEILLVEFLRSRVECSFED